MSFFGRELAESCVLLWTRKEAGKCFMLCSYPLTTHRSCYGDRDEKWWKWFNLGISLNSPAQVGMMTLIFCGVDSVRRWTDGHTPRLQWQQWQHEKFDVAYSISFCCGPFGHPTNRGEALKRPQWQFLTWGGVVRQPKGQRHLGVVKKVFCARLWAD